MNYFFSCSCFWIEQLCRSIRKGKVTYFIPRPESHNCNFCSIEQSTQKQRCDQRQAPVKAQNKDKLFNSPTWRLFWLSIQRHITIVGNILLCRNESLTISIECLVISSAKLHASHTIWPSHHYHSNLEQRSDDSAMPDLYKEKSYCTYIVPPKKFQKVEQATKD